jgi:glyoxylase-like metal-dependent hydrolase (beta-lactamase superfamily II)
VLELEDGIRRITFPLPVSPGHVHCYLLPEADGFTLVDTGLGLPDLAERWAALLAEIDRPVVRIVITHLHPDHVGGSRDAAAATGATVHQGEVDFEQSERVWGSPNWEKRMAAWFAAHGMPRELADELLEVGAAYRPFIRYSPDPVRLHTGDRVESWMVHEFPGHADGHLCLLREGVLVAGDHLLPGITPTVGLYPEARPDPLADYLQSLERTIELEPRLALPGHGDPIRDPARRAREIVAHHLERLEQTAAALGAEPRTAYDLSMTLFPDAEDPSGRRFAVAETLSHVERLVHAGRAARRGDVGSVAYTAAVGRRSPA